MKDNATKDCWQL